MVPVVAVVAVVPCVQIIRHYNSNPVPVVPVVTGGGGEFFRAAAFSKYGGFPGFGNTVATSSYPPSKKLHDVMH